MKTQLIPLETHDDLISIRDRMSWAKTPRILLVWPKSEQIKLRPLDLKVLHRHAASLGAQLGLVTRHRNIRREAQSLGIPVFGTTGEAQRSPWPVREIKKRIWRKPRKDLRKLRQQALNVMETWRSNSFTRILSFASGVFSVLLLAALFIPRAEIYLTPETLTQEVTLPVRADPTLETVFITGNIPAREVRLTVESQQTAPSTGEILIPKTNAKGTVTFRNLTEKEVIIPAGTVLTSTGLPGVRFVTLQAGQLAAGLKATVDVPVEAEKAGSAGNVAAGTILAIEGSYGYQVAVSNTDPTNGGSDRESPAATEEDLAQLQELLLNELQEKAQDEMKRQLSVGDVFFPDTISLEQILEENFDPPPSHPGAKVTLSLLVEYSALYASKEDLSELAGVVLNASAPVGYDALDEPLGLEVLSPPVTDTLGTTRLRIKASRFLIPDLDLARVISLAQGKSPHVARAQLAESLSLVHEPQITLRPSWWPWLPLIPFNIAVRVR